MSKGIKLCPKCNNKINHNWDYCASCSTPLEKHLQPEKFLPWYYQWYTIAILAFVSMPIFLIPAIILLILKDKHIKDYIYNFMISEHEQKNTELKALQDTINSQTKTVEELTDNNTKLSEIKLTSEELAFIDLKNEIIELNKAKTGIVLDLQQLNIQKNEHLATCTEIESDIEKLNKTLLLTQNKISRAKSLYNAMHHSFNKYFNEFADKESLTLTSIDKEYLDELAPTVTLKLHSMDVRDLKKAYTDNEKIIKETLKKYESRYTTKTNIALYKLMVIALQAELQNILINLRYGKLQDAIDQVNTMTKRYLSIAADGNQTIASTMVKFIGEIEYLFTQAVMIEFEYYVKKEQIRQEQLALREQMRQEAEERKALEQQKQQVEKEELKYKKEIDNLNSLINETKDTEKLQQLHNRIKELEEQLVQVEHKKEEIINLQNGKAGNVYIISNFGSFGDKMFKIGMTRRLDPQERINELGSASVPFKFDVHSFIFSDDAVSLEQKLHTFLNNRRVNKVNLRKEFFNVSIEELEELVLNIDPTAEFNTTMFAEEYRQTLSLDDNKEILIA